MNFKCRHCDRDIYFTGEEAEREWFHLEGFKRCFKRRNLKHIEAEPVVNRQYSGNGQVIFEEPRNFAQYSGYYLENGDPL